MGIHPTVETSHQLSGAPVIDIPKTDDHLGDSGVHKASRQADQTLAPHVFSQSCLAGAQHRELGPKVEPTDLIAAKEAILAPSLSVDQRENKPGELGMFLIQDSMCGKVEDSIPLELSAGHS